MAYRKKELGILNSMETELDLAPLLSIMVKLIPVLLLSSAFVHVVVIETELPLKVPSTNERTIDLPRVELVIHNDLGFKILLTANGQQKVFAIPKGPQNQLDFLALNKALESIKERHPDVFTLYLNPDPKVSYDDLIRVTDYARKPLDTKKTFIFSKNGQAEETTFMFTDIQFVDL